MKDRRLSIIKLVLQHGADAKASLTIERKCRSVVSIITEVFGTKAVPELMNQVESEECKGAVSAKLTTFFYQIFAWTGLAKEGLGAQTK